MANTITNLIPDAIVAMEEVSREPMGIIAAVSKNVEATRVSKGTTVRNPVAAKGAAYSISPSMTPLANADLVHTNRTISLDTMYGYKFHFDTEEEMGLKQTGARDTLFQQEIKQGHRVLTAYISSVLGALYYNASRAIGTAGTTPFAADLGLLALANEELKRNGAPVGNRHVVLNHAASYNLGKLTQLVNVNQAGSSNLLTRGEFDPLFGFVVHTDNNIPLHTVGTQTGEDVNLGAGYAIGDTSIVYHGGNSGTLLQGDTIIFTGDTSSVIGGANKYLLSATIAHDEASGTMVLNSPGLLAAEVDTTEITHDTTNFRCNFAMSSDALVLAARSPIGGDSAVDETILVDPVTGIAFRLAEYRGYHTKNYELSVLFGVGLGNPEHMILIQG
jgi:hypothetical protein